MIALQKNNTVLRNMVFSALLLTLFSLFGGLIVERTYTLTKARIIENQRESLLKQLNSLIPPSQYDNDIFQDILQLPPNSSLHNRVNSSVFRARKQGKPIALAFTVTAPDGYNGDITLLMAIYYNGDIAGVRVISHKETPGLGDKIETRHSHWITHFNGKSLYNLTDKQWRVKKDNGYFDQFTGATITPRAVVKAVYKALKFYKQNKELLFTPSVENHHE